MSDLKKAIRDWISILGKDRVRFDPALLEFEGTSTFKATQKIYAILKPITNFEVSAIVKKAVKNTVLLYPVSCGKNWGLGSKVPQRDGVLVDLSSMKKIVDFNESMAYITVEPGVTFEAVQRFLIKKKSSLMLDSIGSTPEASIIGNTAERGHGMALYADRFNFVCGMEVVLANGEIISTGFENFKGSKLGPLAKWGVGPYVDGLFTQSNFGIITKLTLWLRPKPAFFQSFIFHINDEAHLSKLMDCWRRMGLDGLNASLRVFNDVRMISFGERFPEGEKKPLSDLKRAELRAKLNIGRWIGLGGLYSPSKKHAEADKEFIIDKIKTFVEHIEFYDQATVDDQYEKGDQAVKNKLDFLFNKSLLRGYTSRAGINMVYWRKPDDVKVNEIHKDKCGVIWYCPAIPFTGKDSRKAIKICERICKKYGFELNLGFLFISQRTLDITGAICYDRDVKGDDEKAMQCHDAIMDAMIKQGYSPYRLGIQSMDLMKFKKSGTTQFIKLIKKALDPANILAPGHYTG